MYAEEVYKTYTDMGEVKGPALTVSEVLASRDKHHRQIITVEGRTGEITFKETGNGWKFTLFRFFEDDPEKRINVYARGVRRGNREREQDQDMGPLQQAQEVFSVQAEEHHEGEENSDIAGLEMNVKAGKGRVGSSFEDFLKEQGIYEEVTENAMKRVLAFRLAEIMKEQNITKAEMAKRLDTSRSQLDRLLDPENDGVTLDALSRAVNALGYSLNGSS